MRDSIDVAEPGPELVSALYSEACESLRHYSSAVLNLRTLAVVQGLTIIAATAYMAREGERIYSFAGSVFGFTLTSTLWILHQNYYRHFEVFLDRAISLERVLAEGHIEGPWSSYRTNRQTRTGSYLKRIVLHYGTFMLIMSAFVVLALYCLIPWDR